MKKGYKKCPFCANEIKELAIKCQFCGEFLDNEKHTDIKHKDSSTNSNKKGIGIYLLIGLGVLILGLIAYFLFSRGGNNSSYENIIDGNIIDENIIDENIIDENIIDENIIDENTNIGDELIGNKTFDTSIDTSSWKTYDDGEISFQYPSNIVVGNTKFEDFSFFKDPTNIHIQKYDFKSFFEPMIEEDWGREEFFCDYYDEIKGACHSTTHDKFYDNYTKNYKEILRKIKSGEKVELDGFFDHFSGFWTKGPFAIKNVTVNGVRGLLIYYYFTQDPGMACFTQFNTELLLVKDDDKIYSFMFKNNFGGVYNLMNQYDHEYGESCLYDALKSRAEFVNNQLEDFYKNGTTLKGTDYEVFAENDEIIKSIINTVVIK